MQTLKIGKSPTGPKSKLNPPLPAGRGSNLAVPVQVSYKAVSYKKVCNIQGFQKNVPYVNWNNSRDNLHENKDIFKKLRHVIFCSSIKTLVIRTRGGGGGGGQSRAIFLVFSTRIFKIFSSFHSIILH